MSQQFICVYCTASSHAEAMAIGRRLVEDRLVACVNVQQGQSTGAVVSIYRWDGRVQEDQEVAFVCKTRRDLFDRVAATIREVHSYETPCVIAWPIVEIDAEYAAWLLAETTPIESSTT